MENNGSSGGVSIGFGSLLTIAFVVLKLTHVIDWRWIWVLAPLWGGAAIVLLILGIVILVAALLD